MGAWTGSGIAALLLAVLLPARAASVTVWEPIARISLEGGYDSNALFLGQGSDRTGRISPDLGLRLHDHLWDLKAVYGGDYLVYERLQPNGIWNHRGELRLDATPTRRVAVTLLANLSEVLGIVDKFDDTAFVTVEDPQVLRGGSVVSREWRVPGWRRR